MVQVVTLRTYIQVNLITEEERKKISVKLEGIPKSEETKQRMKKSANDPKAKKLQRENGHNVGISNKGKPANNRRKVQVDDKIFECLKDAAKFLNSSSSALCRALNNGNGKFKENRGSPRIEHIIMYRERRYD